MIRNLAPHLAPVLLAAATVPLVAHAVAAAEKSPAARKDVKVEWGRRGAGQGTAAFEVAELPRPWKDDAAAKATVAVLYGEEDPKSKAERLTDGKLPTIEDGPPDNFFFGEGVPGGRVLLDFGRVVNVAEVNTYSWHRDARGPQVYALYASDGTPAGFNARPAAGVEPAKAGWTLIARVDTRPGQTPTGEGGAAEQAAAAAEAIARRAAQEGAAAAAAAAAGDGGGGQYAVRIGPAKPTAGPGNQPAPPLGRYRYLLFDISSTDLHERWDNTFFSEIDVIDADHAPTEPVVSGSTTRGDNPDPNGL